ncbi:MAG: caspase family protein [Desulfomonile tiedjei]|uniref:Caspase family protein n=1 Tax=Desulfomonile tiedjei TaxID=2358 RepID=A0A9D6V413_9BACT|nr:caspase family protein [Desulfomonile tiedjei]
MKRTDRNPGFPVLRVSFLVLVVCLLGLMASAPFLAAEQDRAIVRSSQPVDSDDGLLGPGDLYAVVVGVSRYGNPNVPQLSMSDKDAKDFAAFLQTQNKLYHKLHLISLLNEQATKKEVERTLLYELRKAGKDDTVVIFLSGHGASDPNMPGEFFFLTHDADPDILGATAVNLSRMRFLDRLDSKRILLIADTCHAGGFSMMGNKSIDPPLKKFMRDVKESQGRVIMSSCRPDEISREDPALGNGVFTYYLLEGLKGRADSNGDGVVSLKEAYDYVYTMAKNSTKGVQHPQWEGRLIGAFPLSLWSLGNTLTAGEETSERSEANLAALPPSGGQERDRLTQQAKGGDVQAQNSIGLMCVQG